MRQNWGKYIDSNDNLQFPKYLYDTVMDTMKITLDLGTLVCTDAPKLRAYKERVKAVHKEKWLEIASVLEFLEIIQPCVCANDEFCAICGGSRYLLSETMTADEVEQVSFAFNNNLQDDKKVELAQKLRMNNGQG